MTRPTLHWSILKVFLNNKKAPCILPLQHENRFIVGFRSKAKIFNTFAKKCSHINSCNDLLATLTKKTYEPL